MKHFAMLTVMLAVSCPLVTLAAGETATTTINTPTWDTENMYWKNNYNARPYYNSSRGYPLYEPAYHYGVDLYNQNPGKRYEDLTASDLSTGWSRARGSSNLDWSDAQPAARDAYTRMYESRNDMRNGVPPSTAPTTSGTAGTNK